MVQPATDFLTALAARSGLSAREAPALAAPRLPTRFEPVAPNGPELVEAAPNAVAAPAQPVAERAPAKARPAPPPDTRRIDDRPPREAEPAATQTIERLIREREIHTVRIIEREPPRKVEPEMNRPAPAGLAHSPRPAPPAAAAQTAPRPAAVQPPPLAPRPTALPGRIAPRPEAPRPPALPGPDVQITIGRIEVRAATPERPARRGPERSPAPDLERYLAGGPGAGGGG